LGNFLFSDIFFLLSPHLVCAAHIEMWNRNFVDQLGGYAHDVGDAIDT
jgi:hypothetical protein